MHSVSLYRSPGYKQWQMLREKAPRGALQVNMSKTWMNSQVYRSGWCSQEPIYGISLNARQEMNKKKKQGSSAVDGMKTLLIAIAYISI